MGSIMRGQHVCPRTAPQIASARPEMTATIMVETGLGEGLLSELVDAPDQRGRRDALRGPIFATRA